MSPHACLSFGWCWVLLGLLSGTLIGLYFHRPGWLGGYDAWPRRMVRLGHIAFLGTGFLNILFALSVAPAVPGGATAAGGPLVRAAGACWVAGAVAMPAVCFLAGWREALRRLFFIPVLAMLGGGLLTAWAVLGAGR